MCGIAGYHGLPADRALLTRMNDCQQHRGPDGDGITTDGPCGLAHRRLSIIDIAHGQQPMETPDGRYVIAYNGEVYNYLDLRSELQAQGRTFATDSDTEVVLQAFAQWGPEAFDRFNGMFGLAIWDRREERLTLARDHFGIKPLYVARVANPEGDGEVLLFSSEIKPILASGLYEKKVNERSVYRYLRFRAHEDGTQTFFDGIERLAPGEMLTADATGIQRSMFTRLKEELLELASVQRPYDDAAAAEYRRRLVESVRLRLQSEVPVGTSLSGGLDSSAVAVIINQLLGEGDALSLSAVGTRQNTFSAVFPGSINDEERYVDDVLDICTGHVESHKILPTADEFKADLLDFVRTQEEPLISSGPYAQFQVMREATKHVTVLLDGQGADEMMAGYIPYYAVYLRQLRAQGATLAAAELAKSLDVLYRLGRFKLKAKLRLKKSLPTTALLDRAFVTLYADERYSSEGANLKKRLVEDLFHNSLPSLLRYEDKNTMRFCARGARAVPRQGGAEVHLRPLRRGDHQGRLEQEGAARCHARPAARVDQPPPQQDRLHHAPGRVVHEAEEPLLQHLPQRVLRQPPVRQPDRGASRRSRAGSRAANDVDTMTFWRLINLELWLREFFDDRDEDADAAAPPARPTSRPTTRPTSAASLDLATATRRGRAPLPRAHRAVQQGRRPRRPRPRARRRLLRRARVGRARARRGDDRPVVVLHLREGRRDHPGPLLLRLGHQGRPPGPRAVALRDAHPGRHRPRSARSPCSWPSRRPDCPASSTPSAGGALGKVIGRKGLFYELVGNSVNAIDGPTEYSAYPSNVSAKLAPKDPDEVAARLTAAIRERLPEPWRSTFAGHGRHGRQRHRAQRPRRDVPGPWDRYEEMFADNPLGQGSEQTPMAIVFLREE